MNAEGGESTWKGAKTASAATKDIKTVSTNEDIAKVLPHRYPFLLVDKIIEFEPGKRAVGIKQVCLAFQEYLTLFEGNSAGPF